MVNFPNVEFVHNRTTVNPSGHRHENNTSFGFIRELGTGAGQELNFGQLNTTGSGNISQTQLVYARVDNFGDASGVFNMRLYWHNISAWGAGTYRFLERKEIHFQNNLSLNSAANNTPTVVPSQPNLSGTRQPGWTFGSPWMSGTGDGFVSQYVWLAVEVGNNVNVGTVGGAGAGTWRMRLLFDFS